MKKLLVYSFCAAGIALSLFSCKNKDGEERTDFTNDQIKAEYKAKDSAVLDAYLNDKSTISANDIDLKDTSYSARSKFLYKSESGALLAVVYGFKKDNSMGIVIVQEDGKEPMKLPETKRGQGFNETEYSDGKRTLQRSGTFVFLDGVQYIEIK